MIKSSAEERSHLPQRDEITKAQIANARAVVKFAVNLSSCRRQQVLQFFGEKFNRSACQSHCDNCLHQHKLIETDLCSEARMAVELIKWYEEQGKHRLSVAMARDIFKGSNTISTRKNEADGCPQYKAGKTMSSDLIELLFDLLLAEEILDLRSERLKSRMHNEYLVVSHDIPNMFFALTMTPKLGPNAANFLQSTMLFPVKYHPPSPSTAITSPKKRRERTPGIGQILSPSSTTFTSSPPLSKSVIKATPIPKVKVEATPIALYADDSDEDGDFNTPPQSPVNMIDIVGRGSSTSRSVFFCMTRNNRAQSV